MNKSVSVDFLGNEPRPTNGQEFFKYSTKISAKEAGNLNYKNSIVKNPPSWGGTRPRTKNSDDKMSSHRPGSTLIRAAYFLKTEYQNTLCIKMVFSIINIVFLSLLN